MNTAANQMQELVDEFGGFLWFMMPDVVGLSIELQEKDSISYIAPALESQLICVDNKCQLPIDVENSSTDKAIEFKQAPVVISPWIEK